MLRLLGKLYWKLSGWKVAGEFPYHLKKMVIIVAPHTSWKDLLIGFAVRNKLKIEHANFLGKKELFNGPFGGLFRGLGGIPVDRLSNSKHGIVEQAVSLFNENEIFILAIAPEGTRKQVKKLRSGFYQIATMTNVPIVPFGFDFENKQVIIGNPFFVSGNEEGDLKKILAFFSTIKGKNPAFDLHHLSVVE
jgi:1-acyl-sn-glycerol-3-phosphate acyltransferase